MRMLSLAAFAAALIFTLVMAWLPNPPTMPLGEDDKLWHVIVFVTLSVLASLAFPAARLWRIGERLSFLGALIEVVQSIPVLHRDCDIKDWVADTIAVAAALALVAGARRLRRRESKAASPENASKP
jgi:hypothetical protein